MVITSDQMAEQSKRTTTEELSKLHATIKRNPSLVRRSKAPKRRLSEDDTDTDSDSDSDSESYRRSSRLAALHNAEDILMQLDMLSNAAACSAFSSGHQAVTVHKIRDCTASIRNRIVSLSNMVQRCKSVRDETERRYEQIRIENSTLNLRVDDLVNSAEESRRWVRKMQHRVLWVNLAFVSLLLIVGSHCWEPS